MGLSKKDAQVLYELGFKRASYADKAYPQDVFEIDDVKWVLGGSIVPGSKFLCDEKVYKAGTWIPQLDDLFTWLTDNECSFTLTANSLSVKIEVADNNGKVYKEKAGTLEFALYKVISKILRVYKGNPVNRKYEVVEAKFVSKDE